MKKISPIAFLVIKAELRRKIIYFSVLIACLIIFASKTFTSITPGAEQKFIIDMSFTWINIIGVLIVLITATDVISGEERGKTDYFFRTNPVSDFELIVGKFTGSAGVVVISVTIMQMFYLLFSWVLFKQISFEQIKGFILMDFQLVMLAAIAIFSSCLFSRFTSILFCISTYFTGILSSYVVHLAHSHSEQVEIEGFSDKIAMLVYKHLPNFDKFDVTEYLILELPIEKKLFFGGIKYGIFSISIIVFLSVILWKLKNRFR